MRQIAPRFRAHCVAALLGALSLALSGIFVSEADGQNRFHCPDGTSRLTMDLQTISIRYHGASFAATLSGLGMVRSRLEIDEKTLQHASAATQEWNELLKGLVLGWNSCVISEANFREGLERIYPGLRNDMTALDRILRAVTDGRKVDERRLRFLLERYLANIQKFSRLARQDIERVTGIVERATQDIVKHGDKNTSKIMERLDEIDKRTVLVKSPEVKEQAPESMASLFTKPKYAEALKLGLAPLLPEIPAGGLAVNTLGNPIPFHGRFNDSAMGVVTPSILSLVDRLSFDSPRPSMSFYTINALGEPQHFGSPQKFAATQLTTTSLPGETVIKPFFTGLGVGSPGGGGLVANLDSTLLRFNTSTPQHILGSLHIDDATTGKAAIRPGAIIPSALSYIAPEITRPGIWGAVITSPSTMPYLPPTALSGASASSLTTQQTLPAERLFRGNIPETTIFAKGVSPTVSGDKLSIEIGVPSGFTHTTTKLIDQSVSILVGLGDPSFKGSLSDHGARSFARAADALSSGIVGVDPTVIGSVAWLTSVVPSYNEQVPSWDASRPWETGLVGLRKYADLLRTVDGPCR